MDTKQFVDRYLGKGIDFDKAYGNQCTDVFRQFNKDVYGFQHTGGVEGAKDLFLKYDTLKGEVPIKDCYYKIPNGPGVLPIEGDIVIYDATPSNKFGHVAIVLWASQQALVVLEQDGFNPTGVSYIKVRDYKNCLGFLRRK